MFAIGNRVRVKATFESRSSVVVPAGTTGRVHFVPGPEWGNEMIIILDKPLSGPKSPTPRSFILVDFNQVELVSANERG
jgi:hypothetical protein